MGCGASDVACQLIELILKHAGEIADFARWFPWVEQHVREHIKELAGIIGVCFGIWKWWNFREKVLHKRLREYLDKQDGRLSEARSYIVEALQRPTNERTFSDPIFSVGPLRRILRRKGWSRLLRVSRLETSADRLLDAALEKLEGQLEAAEKQLSLYQSQRASAHLLKGAIASARVATMASQVNKVELDHRSLDAFRAALQVPGYQIDLELLEYEAHQLKKLGYLSEADAAYVKIENIFLGQGVVPSQALNFTLARIKRARAIIAQAQSVDKWRSGHQSGRGSLTAYGMLKGTATATSAINLRESYGPFQAWDGIDQAELHYITAYVCNNLNFTNEAPTQLGLAETEYRRVLDAHGEKTWFSASHEKRLRGAAAEGLRRVRAARDGKYEEEWLLPPSKPLERQAEAISHTGGQQSVDKAAQQN